ncbi:hypothetical protein B0T13DRAFT_443880 [Neurospora crassa]|nr:hypothetical protein B0T13DRAFT_443880 [Neurospora crassa]
MASRVFYSRTDLDVETSRVGSLSRTLEMHAEWSRGVDDEDGQQGSRKRPSPTNGTRAWTAGLGYTDASKWAVPYERKRREERTKEKVGNKSHNFSCHLIGRSDESQRRTTAHAASDAGTSHRCSVDFQIGG